MILVILCLTKLFLTIQSVIAFGNLWNIENKEMITLFTPTYNRAPLLPRLYQSLLNQSNANFEWIIVDDGSTDNTETIVNHFTTEAKINIVYQKQENKGKHFAINRGVELAKGDYFFIVDSDDLLPAKSIETVFNLINTAKKLPSFGGVSGTLVMPDGKSVGNNNFESIYCDSIQIRTKYKIEGDLAEVFKTEVLKEFPFPEIEKEKFCPEVLVWNRIAQKYKLYYTDNPIYIAEYQLDGLTAKIVKIRMNAPMATMLTYSELAKCKIPLSQKIRATINYWRFAFNSNQSFGTKIKRVNPILSVFALPLGYLMYKRDVKKFLN